MDVATLKQKIGDPNLVLLDVREPEEYKAGNHVDGTKNIPMDKVLVEATKENLPNDKRLIAICQSGGRGEIIARELRKQGFNIDYLDGGMNAWNREQGT